MHWTEPATSDDSHAALEKTLWNAANQLWAGATLKPSEYSPTVLGLIFLRHADVRFAAVAKEILPSTSGRGAGGEGLAASDTHSGGARYRDTVLPLNEELEVLNNEARELETRIAENVTELLEA